MNLVVRRLAFTGAASARSSDQRAENDAIGTNDLRRVDWWPFHAAPNLITGMPSLRALSARLS